MSVIAFGSIKASPGLTTTVLALASVWSPDRSLLIVEADPDGGDLAVRAGLHPEPGLTSLAAAGRRSTTAAQGDQHVQRLPGGTRALLGPPDAEQAIRALEMIGDGLGLSGLDDRDVLIDCGRLRPQSPAATFVAQADIVVIVARPRLDELQHLRARVDQLTASGAQVRREITVMARSGGVVQSQTAGSFQFGVRLRSVVLRAHRACRGRLGL